MEMYFCIKSYSYQKFTNVKSYEYLQSFALSFVHINLE